MKENPLKNQSYAFAIRVVKLSQYLQSEQKDYILSKQVLRSSTAIGALIHEAEFGQSRADFTSKMNISLKESNETQYWLSLLKDTGYIKEEHFSSMLDDCKQLTAMLVATVKTSKITP